MSFSINTNVASLQAQNNLRLSSDFQGKTIQRVTSGLRIVSSGDDAAGLAIANGYRSDEAVLTQGVRNANDGLSQLQIADGGLNNISQLLDRARTLATQSSSGAFTGDRSVLNSEFQSVVGEIDRQAQAVGLNQGGQFAQSLSVFIGGGKTSNGISAISNGSINLDLSHSSVDSRSLGLTGVQSVGTAGSDIGGTSASSVANVIASNVNLGSESKSGYTTFSISGPGFSGANKVNVSVNLSGVTDSNTLVSAINNAIQSAGGTSSQYATAFKNANITAALNVDTQGKTQLTFSSSNSAFQVQAGDRTANALLGNVSSGADGASLAATVTGAATANPTQQTVVGSAVVTPVVVGGTNNSLKLTVGGTSATLTLTSGTYNTVGSLATEINTQIAAGGLAGTATASINANNELVLTATALATSVSVNAPVGNDAAASVGLADGLTSSITPALTNNDKITLRFQGAGLSGPVDVTLNQIQAGTTTVGNVLSDLTSKVGSNSQLSAAGITVTGGTAGAALQFSDSNGQQLSVQATGDTTNVLGLGSFVPNALNAVDATSVSGSLPYSTSTTVNGTASLGISLNGGANQVISASLTGAATDATAGKTVGTTVLTSATTDFSAAVGTKQVSLKIDGGAQINIGLAAAATTATQILTAFNTNGAFSAVATASYDAAGHLSITSKSTGATSGVQVVAAGAGASDVATLGLVGLTAGTNSGANASETNVLQQLNSAIALNTTLVNAGLKAVDNGGAIQLTSTNSTHFRLDAYGAGDVGFGNAGAAFAGTTSSAAPATSPYFDAQGAVTTQTLAFNPVVFGGDKQTLSFSALDSAGAPHTASVSLNSGNARSLDETIATINTGLQQTNDATLQQVVAVKENTGGVEGIKFVSKLSGFNVSVGAVGKTSGTEGIGDAAAQGTIATAAQAGAGSTADISNQSSAQAAVNALANSVATLGKAQAVVGRGQNQFTYAINLAQSQLTNTASAESRVRDADLAAESANLTKAQILIQAGVAALAQANSAPQQVISLLQGR